MAFDEVTIDDATLGAGMRASIERATDVVDLKGGDEHRNTPWSNSLREYTINVKTLASAYALIEFWEGRRGPLRGFRWKDWTDFKSVGPTATISNTDQAMASLTSTTFQLQKTYSPAANSWTRTITKPVDNGSITIKDDTGALAETTDYTVDYTTGIVTFGTAPTGTPTAGFEFDVPVRFRGNKLPIDLRIVDIGSSQGVTLVEVRK